MYIFEYEMRWLSKSLYHLSLVVYPSCAAFPYFRNRDRKMAEMADCLSVCTLGKLVSRSSSSSKIHTRSVQLQQQLQLPTGTATVVRCRLRVCQRVCVCAISRRKVQRGPLSLWCSRLAPTKGEQCT